MKSLQVKMNLRTRYKVLKQIVIILGLLEYLGLGGGFYFAGKAQFQESLLFFVLMGVSYWVSSNLGYKVLEYLVKLQSKEN